MSWRPHIRGPPPPVPPLSSLVAPPKLPEPPIGTSPAPPQPGPPALPGGPVGPPILTKANTFTAGSLPSPTAGGIVNHPVTKTTNLSSSSGTAGELTLVFTPLQSLATTRSEIQTRSLESPKTEITFSPTSSITPTFTSPSFQLHADNAKHWIIPLAVALPILLVCSGLLALRIRRRRIIRMHETSSSTPIQSKLFDVSPALPIQSLPMHDAGSEREMEVERQSIRSIVTQQNYTGIESSRISILISGDDRFGFSSTSQSSREEVEALRERLRVVEAIALSLSDHTMGADDIWSLERELRELILPPPDYTNTSRDALMI